MNRGCSDSLEICMTRAVNKCARNILNFNTQCSLVPGFEYDNERLRCWSRNVRLGNVKQWIIMGALSFKCNRWCHSGIFRLYDSIKVEQFAQNNQIVVLRFCKPCNFISYFRSIWWDNGREINYTYIYNMNLPGFGKNWTRKNAKTLLHPMV